jgi:hypothetical protein
MLPFYFVAMGITLYILIKDNDKADNIPTITPTKDRTSSINKAREDMPCFFWDGLSFEEFESMAIKVGKRLKRVENIKVNAGIVCGQIESQSGISHSDFIVDFNDWGHITGKYWIWKENDDSLLPNHFAEILSERIQEFYAKKGISLISCSDLVDMNIDLGTDDALSYVCKESLFTKLFKRNREAVTVPFGADDFIDEHLYPVFSIFKRAGFTNIQSYSIKDIDQYNVGFSYQVEKVEIDGDSNFKQGTAFPKNAPISITYREKKEIEMPYSARDLKRQNYTLVANKLKDLGFTEVCGLKINDLKLGWIIEEGSVEDVCIDEGRYYPIKKKSMYPYDQKIVISYHVKNSE